MPCDQAADIVRLAIRPQGSWSGASQDDARHEFEVSRTHGGAPARRRGGRARAAGNGGHGGAKRHCRLRTLTLRHFV